MHLARGGIAAAFATSAAALSHVLSDGNAPHPLLALLSLTISTLVCIALAGRVLSFKNLMATVVASEGLFHLLFSLFSGTQATMLDPSIAAVQYGRVHSGGFPFVSAYMAMDHAGHSSGMWLNHGTAAVLTIVFLRYDEASAVLLLDTLHMRVTAITEPVAPIAAPLSIDGSPWLWPPQCSHTPHPVWSVHLPSQPHTLAVSTVHTKIFQDFRTNLVLVLLAITIFE